jgi:DNA-binding CsgD family transcriptional regulator
MSIERIKELWESTKDFLHNTLSEGEKTLDIATFWVNGIGFSMLFGIFFLTYLSHRTNRHVMFSQYLWYIALSWLWFLFQFIGFMYQVLLQRDVQSIIMVIAVVRLVFTIMVFHRIPLFIDTIVYGSISNKARGISLVMAFSVMAILALVEITKAIGIGPYISVFLNGMVGAFFLFAFIKIKNQQHYRAQRMRSFLLISAVAFFFFGWYAALFIVFPHRHRPSFDALVSALFIIVWCVNDVMIYLREFSSSQAMETNRLNTFYDQHQLSKREQEIIKLLVDGLSYKEIAFRLSVSPRTVETHVYRIFKKCSVSTKLELVNKIFSLRTST